MYLNGNFMRPSYLPQIRGKLRERCGGGFNKCINSLKNHKIENNFDRINLELYYAIYRVT